MTVKCLIFCFLPSWTGLISIQSFSVYHVYIVITVEVNIQRYMLNLILTNEWNNLLFCTLFKSAIHNCHNCHQMSPTAWYSFLSTMNKLNNIHPLPPPPPLFSIILIKKNTPPPPPIILHILEQNEHPPHSGLRQIWIWVTTLWKLFHSPIMISDQFLTCNQFSLKHLLQPV